MDLSTTLGSGRIVQLEPQDVRIDPRQLEEIVDERGECLHLLADCGQVLPGLGESVFERFEHRPQRRERSAQIVACPGDELAPGVDSRDLSRISRQFRMGRAGIEPATLGLKVPCSTD